MVSAVVHGATPDIADGDVQTVKEATIGDMTLTNFEVIFADFHVFKLWELDQEPAMLIGMDMLGVLDRLVIDYRRNEVSMFGERSSAVLAPSSAEALARVRNLTRQCLL